MGKHKRNGTSEIVTDLTEQQTERKSSDQQMKSHQNNKTKQKKNKLDNESVHCESPPCKKRKKLKGATNDELETVQSENTEKDVTIDLDVDGDHQNKELVKKKKKKKHKMEEIESLQGQKQDEADVTIEPEMENTEYLVKKKKKKHKKKVDDALTDEMECLPEIKQEETDVMVHEEENSNKTEKLVKKKKEKSNEKHNSEDGEDLTSSPRNVNTERRKKKSKNEEPVENFDVLLEKIKEFVPNIEAKELINVKNLIKYDLPRFEEFKRQGISIILGRFTVKENARLRKNVEDFLALTGIDDATKLFFTHRYKDEEEQIRFLKKQHKFFIRIAEGIPRSCYYIYSRGRKIFDERGYKGVFSKEELHQLVKLHTLHGSNWKKISELTGRSASSLQKRIAHISEKEGSWSKDELQRLLKAVQEHVVSQLPRNANSNTPIKVRKQTLYHHLPWLDISAKVKTRSWSKCREKWMVYLASKMSTRSLLTEKTALDMKIKLIKVLYETEVEDAAFIDWENIAAVIGDVPPAYAQRKWLKIKVCHVPQWQTKSFADIVDFLYEKVLPRLEEKFAQYRDSIDTEENQNPEYFLISDIFRDCNGEQNNDDCDED